MVKTHTPADGFPIWDGVTVVAVYRHPLDVFFSLRTHVANRTNPNPDDPRTGPVPQAIRAYVCDTLHRDLESLETLAAHYTKTALSGRLPDLKLFHYSDMVQDGRPTVEALAAAAGIDAGASVTDAVTKATAFGAMKAKAADYAPVAGTGFWKSDAHFFASGGSNKWEGELSEEDIAIYRGRLEALIPDPRARHWLEYGSGWASTA